LGHTATTNSQLDAHCRMTFTATQVDVRRQVDAGRAARVVRNLSQTSDSYVVSNIHVTVAVTR